MIGGVAPVWISAAIAAAVTLGLIRTVLWRRAAMAEARGPTWRFVTLIALQLAAGALLHLTLSPPSVGLRSGELIVLTAGAALPSELGAGDVLVALPEAPAHDEAVRTPDLATALRRHPEVARLRILGRGLTPRDQAPVALPVVFDPPPLPRGLVSIAYPPAVAAGGTTRVGGRVGASGVVELLDPAGAVVDRRTVAAGQDFDMPLRARTAGLSIFALRLRDADDQVVETVAVPLETRAEPAARVLILAGAPGPEIKYLRRWAEDSGINLSLRIDLGAGLALADAAPALGVGTLEVDLVVVDDRSWERLSSAERSALGAAVADGMGLLLRPTADLAPSVRRDWAALGLQLSGGGGAAPVSVEDGPADPVPTSDGSAGTETEALPELTRRDLALVGSNNVSVLRDAQGATLGGWTHRGAGRVGVFTLADSYALVLTGRPDRYGEMWSTLFSALARPRAASGLRVEAPGRVGRRMALCGVAGPTLVEAPGGGRSALLADPSAGPDACAAYWPTEAGWHLAQDDKGVETPFYVQTRDAAPSVTAAADRQATIAMAARSGSQAAAQAQTRGAGAVWPWFIGLLAALAALWWLERSRPTGLLPRRAKG